MNNLQLPQSAENKYILSEEYERKIQSAYHRMRPKIFIERFKNLNLIAQIGIFFFPVISIVTSVSFIYGHIQDAINNLYISVIVAVLLLAMLELTKNHLLTTSLDTFFSNSGRTLGTFVFAFLFSCLSFILSFNGAAMLVHNLDTSKQEIKDSTAAQLATVDKIYSAQIAAEQVKINSIGAMASKQWHGLNTPQQTELLNSLENNVRDLRATQKTEKERILAEKFENMNKAETSVSFNAWVFKVFAGIIELMLILSITFNAYYAFKTVREDMDLKKLNTEMSADINIDEQQAKILPGKSTFEAPQISLNTTSTRNVVKGFMNNFFDEHSSLNGERYTENDSTKRTCKQCGTEFDYKHWNKQFCSSECRINYWQAKTGVKLQLKKKQA